MLFRLKQSAVINSKIHKYKDSAETDYWLFDVHLSDLMESVIIFCG